MPDPKLQTAANEIIEVLKKYDIAGYALLGSQTHTHYIHKLDASWNCLTFEGADVMRVRSKREDYASKEEQGEVMRLTIGLLQGIVDAGNQDMETLQKLLIQIGKTNEYSHVSTVENPTPTKAAPESADIIMKSMVALCEAESKSTQGDWRVRELPGSDDFFVERPKQEGEPYGVQILGDDEYKDKRGDAEFIVLAKKIALTLRKLILP